MTGCCHWSPCSYSFCLQVWRDNRGKQACRALKETSAFSLCFSAARSQDFSWVTVDKASTIEFCNFFFFPPARVNTYNLSSQRRIWVQTRLSMAWGVLHSAPTNFCRRQNGYYSEWKWNFLVIKGGGFRRRLIFSAQRPVLLNRHRCSQRGAPEKSPASPPAKISTFIGWELRRRRGLPECEGNKPPAPSTTTG